MFLSLIDLACEDHHAAALQLALQLNDDTWQYEFK